VAGFEVLLLKTSVCAALRTFGQIGVDVAISSDSGGLAHKSPGGLNIKSTYTYVRRERVIFHFIRSGGKTSLRQARKRGCTELRADDGEDNQYRNKNYPNSAAFYLPLRSFKYTALLSRQNNGS